MTVLVFVVHESHVIPSMVISVRTMSAVKPSLEANRFAVACGKHKKKITIAVAVHNMTLFMTMIFERLALLVALGR